MPKVELHIEVECANPHQHEAISSLLLTTGHMLDIAIEGKHEKNDVKFKVVGAHPEAQTKADVEENALRKQFGL